MHLLKLPFKLIALPIVLATSLLQGIGILLVSVSTTVINMVLGVVSFIVIASWVLGFSSQGTLVSGLTLCLVLFIMPQVAKWCLIGIALCNAKLKEFVRS
ncbi:MAG: hypothetical protein RR696_12985 [Clostridia bacterium]